MKDQMSHMVRATTLQGIAELVRELGADADAVLAESRIRRQSLDKPESWIPFESVVMLYELAANATSCPAFGLRLSESRGHSYLGPLVLIFRYSENLESGLRSAIRYLAIQNTGYEMSFRSESGEATWEFILPAGLRPEADQWIEESLYTAMSLLRIFLGEEYRPQRVSVRHKRLSPERVYTDRFGIEPVFGGNEDSITIRRSDLVVPNPIGDRDMYLFLKSYLDARVADRRDDICATVQDRLRDLVPTGKFSIDVLSDQLGMHSRTLQRRLEKAGSSYVELLDQCRSEMAMEYLRTSNLPMVNVALMLGYSDQSAFNHAFKRWHGTSPREWLRRRVGVN